MAKQLRKKNIPSPASASSSDDDDLPPAVDPTPAEEEIRAGTSAGPGVQDVAASADQSAPKDAVLRWSRMAEQLETLKNVLAQLCELVTPRAASEGDVGGPQEPGLSSMSTPSATRHEDAILGVAHDERREAAILGPPRRKAAILSTPRCDAMLNMPPDESAAGGCAPRIRSRHLTTVKEFSIGVDWNAFACRFLAAVRSARWTDAEALEVLTTLLDDESVRFFRSIKAAKKKTLRGVFDEMADAYEPPDDAHRRFVQRQRAPEESPVAYRGVVLELAMAAYPEMEPDLLEPLILGKMLELSRDLGIPMPVCGHKKLTSRAAAKCLDAQFNLRRWKQVTAWTGGPIVEGGAVGWDPKKAVYVPDDRSPQELSAAAAPWPGPRAAPPTRPRRDGAPAARRNNIDCFRCGRKGHYARDCWAHVPGPPQQEASTAAAPRKDSPAQASVARFSTPLSLSRSQSKCLKLRLSRGRLMRGRLMGDRLMAFYISRDEPAVTRQGKEDSARCAPTTAVEPLRPAALPTPPRTRLRDASDAAPSRIGDGTLPGLQ
ncbi:unnamed protein product [Lampetra fluviatilis]